MGKEQSEQQDTQSGLPARPSPAHTVRTRLRTWLRTGGGQSLSCSESPASQPPCLIPSSCQEPKPLSPLGTKFFLEPHYCQNRNPARGPPAQPQLAWAAGAGEVENRVRVKHETSLSRLLCPPQGPGPESWQEASPTHPREEARLGGRLRPGPDPGSAGTPHPCPGNIRPLFQRRTQRLASGNTGSWALPRCPRTGLILGGGGGWELPEAQVVGTSPGVTLAQPG